MDKEQILNDRRIMRNEMLKCKYSGYGDLYFGYDKRKTKFLIFEQGRILLDYLVALWRTYPAHSAVPRTYISFMEENR